MPQALGLVSVVIPTYNAANFVGEAIQSVLDQTYERLEVLVIDDGSTDNTQSVVHSFSERVCYVKQQNKGVSAARNLGIAKATGRYVAFLDSDDLWLPNKLAEQIPLLDRDADVGLVYSDWSIVPEHGDPLPSFLSKLPAASGYVFDQLVQCGFILTSGTVVRRECLDEVGVFDEALSIAQDYDLWLRISYRWKVALLNAPLTIKRNWDGNLSSNYVKTAVERIILFQKLLNNFTDMPSATRRVVRNQLANNFWDLGHYNFERMSLREARKNFLASLTYNWKSGRSLGYLAASYLPSPITKAMRTVKRAIR